MAQVPTYILYIPLGLLPSIIWLLFYLRKDRHPESKKMIVKIFFYGMLAAVIAAIAEISTIQACFFFQANVPFDLTPFSFLFFLSYHIIVIGLIEETAKFLIVKEKVIDDPEFDEAPDAMIYMIVAALGFAFLENLLYLSPVLFPKSGLLLREAALVAGFRFIGATFLHALASGTIGYFLALSIFNPKKRKRLLTVGIIMAALLHGLFNISIIGIGQGPETNNSLLSGLSLIFLIGTIIFLALFVSLGFKKLKKIKSICKL